MGGDLGPSEAVAAAALAIRDGVIGPEDTIILVGHEDNLRLLAVENRISKSKRIQFKNAASVVQSDDAAMTVIKSKRDSSMMVALDLLKSGEADVVVSTGNTLRQAGLEIFGPVILSSTAQLIAAPGKQAASETLLRRLRGVIVAREYVIFDYDCPVDLVEKASAITPGIESPTISPLRDNDWVAVRALVKASEINAKMDELYLLGARAILVSAIHAARI
jgi:ATP phosphoribosyltransferase-like protein